MKPLHGKRALVTGAALSAPCSAIACAAYSMPTGASRPSGLRKGWSAARWLLARQRMRLGVQSSTASSRHMRPWCGMWAAIQP